MGALRLTRHEWREVLRDTTGFWAPVIALVLRSTYLRRREQRGR